jgi:hypothetical protein
MFFSPAESVDLYAYRYSKSELFDKNQYGTLLTILYLLEINLLT